MEKRNKFVVLYDSCFTPDFRFGKVERHKDLVNDEEERNVLGGGMFSVDLPNKEIIMFGSSADYGNVNNLAILVCNFKKRVLFGVRHFYWEQTGTDVNMDRFNIVVKDMQGGQVKV